MRDLGIRRKRLATALLVIGGLIPITYRLLYSSVCPWLAGDPGEQHSTISTETRFSLTVHVGPRDVKEVQVYSGLWTSGPILINRFFPGCHRVSYAHMVAERPVGLSGSVRFVLPPGDYFAITVLASFETGKREGIPVSAPQNIHLNRDLDVRAPAPSTLLPI